MSQISAPTSSSGTRLEVLEYSEKAIAVFGPTEAFRGPLAEAGGKFNRSLKYGESETRIPGWIFSKARAAAVKQLVNDINAGKTSPASSEPARTSTRAGFEGVDKKAYLALVSRVEELEQELALLKQHLGLKAATKAEKAPARSNVQEDDEETESDDEKEKKASPRLLKAKRGK